MDVLPAINSKKLQKSNERLISVIFVSDLILLLRHLFFSQHPHHNDKVFPVNFNINRSIRQTASLVWLSVPAERIPIPNLHKASWQNLKISSS